MINPGTKLPELTAPACVGVQEGKEFSTFTTRSVAGKWLVLYTYPKDFTFVCPTEIVEFDRNLPAFDKRDALLVGGSTDNEYAHLAWRRSDEALRGLSHPLIHISPELAQALDIVHPSAGVALRATIISDPEGVVRFASANYLSVGRNVEEVLRVLDGLQTGELTACNWRPGEVTLSGSGTR
ncbi:MAG: peroxiredoxin [Proteobacteria bacterium]|nr:peroxiredoxin [Pseudomonadota bacterium]